MRSDSVTECEAQIFQGVEYDGSIEGYNKLIEFIESENPQEANVFCHIGFLDEHGNSTNKFTGIVYDSYTGTIYKPGNVYHVKYED